MKRKKFGLLFLDCNGGGVGFCCRYYLVDHHRALAGQILAGICVHFCLSAGS